MTHVDSKLSRRALMATLTLAAVVLAAPAIAPAATIDLLPLQTFESTFPPTGWAVETPVGPVVWHRNDVEPNYGAEPGAPIAGYHAYAESYPEYCGYAYDTSLITPAFSTEGVEGSISVSFDYQYWNYSSEALDVDYRIGAGPWVNLESQASNGGNTVTSHAIDISETIGYPDVQLRWRYYNNADSGCDWWTNLDNVRVQAYAPSLTQEIPTASTWGLALLATLLAGFGLIVLRRHG